MNGSNFASFFLLLLTSDKLTNSAFLSNGAKKVSSRVGSSCPNYSNDQYNEKYSFGLNRPLSLDERMTSVNQAQSCLEDFVHDYVKNKVGNNAKDEHVTFLKLKGTSAEVYYSDKQKEDGYVAPSASGKFAKFMDIEQSKGFSSPFVFSSGAKSFERLQEKFLKDPNKQIRDSARVSMITSRPEEIYEFCNMVCDYHENNKDNSPFAIDEKNPLIFRGWNKKESGFFSAKVSMPIKTSKGVVYSEVMFVPQSKQNRLAVDILSHAAYEVARKNNSNYYSSESLMKWNSVVRNVKKNNLVDLESIISPEARNGENIEPLTTRNFDINSLKSMFSGLGSNNDGSLAQRKSELEKIQKELNKKAMYDICCDDKWNPYRINLISQSYQFPSKLVKIEKSKLYDGCDVDMGVCR